MFLYPWGDMHSINLGWFLLQFKEWVEKIQEYLDNGGGTSENLANVIAPVFNAANSYLTGDYVMYNDELYKANEAISPGTWDPSKWTRCLAMEEISSGAGIDNVARLMIAGNYSAYYGYQKYAICRYNDKLWMCNTNLPSGGEEWNPTHWDEITVGAGLTGLRRSVETLQSEIENLNSDDVANQSENVPGDNVTEAIDNIFAAISQDETYIAIVQSGNNATKTIRDGQLVILKNNSSLSDALYYANGTIPAGTTFTNVNLKSADDSYSGEAYGVANYLLDIFKSSKMFKHISNTYTTSASGNANITEINSSNDVIFAVKPPASYAVGFIGRGTNGAWYVHVVDSSGTSITNTEVALDIYYITI